MKLMRASSVLRIDFIRKFVSQSFHQRKSINAKLAIHYDNILKHKKQLVHVSSQYKKCCFNSKQSISDQGSRKRKMVSTTTDEISSGNVEKSASQLKKEAKRLAKLEKFSKKQEQAHQKAVNEVIIGNLNKRSEWRDLNE